MLINVPLTFPVFAGWNITISGLNSFYEFALFATDDEVPYDLLTDIALGGECASADLASTIPTEEKKQLSGSDGDTSSPKLASMPCIPLNVTIKGYEHNQNYVDVKLSVRDIQFLLDLFIKMDHTILSDMKVSTFHTQGCIANAINKFQVNSWALHTSSVNFFFVEETQEISLTKLANNIFDLLISPSNQDLLNVYLSSAVQDARDVCSAGGVNPSSSDTTDPVDQKSKQLDSMMHFFRHTWKWKVAVLIVGTLVSFSLLLRMYYKKGVQLDKSVGEYHVKSMTETKVVYPYENLNAAIKGDVERSSDHVERSSDHEVYSNGNVLSNKWIEFYLQRFVEKVCTSNTESIENENVSSLPLEVQPYDSLLGNETMSLFTRLFVIISICIIVFIFVISEIPSSPAALVILEIDMGNQVSPPLTVFKFGLAETIREMWQAEVYYLAILIAFFTGGWPYIKMVAMLLAWVLPTSVLSVAWRNTLLVWLDLLGKWSLVDSFVMMVMMVGFNFSFDIVPGVDIRVTVNPQWGFYAFLLATAASLAIGHFVLACHRLCCAVADKELEEQTLWDQFHDMNHDDHDVVVQVPGDSKLVRSEGVNMEVTEDEQGHDDCADDDVEKRHVHLHAQWNEKNIVSCDSEVESESLMNHVFTVQIMNFCNVDAAPHTSGEENEGNGLVTPLVNQSPASKPFIHLADLAEWTFPQEPSYGSSYDVLVVFTQTGKLCMLILFGFSNLVVLGGTFIPVIEFDFIGLTGYLMDEPVTIVLAFCSFKSFTSCLELVCLLCFFL